MFGLLVGAAAVADSPLRRGDVHRIPNFLTHLELRLLRQHLHDEHRVVTLSKNLTHFPRNKQLLDWKLTLSRHRQELPPELVRVIQGVFVRAYRTAASLAYASDIPTCQCFNLHGHRGLVPGMAEHVSWHGAGSDFPPHVDFEPNCVAILVYITSAGVDFTGGALQIRGCPSVGECPLLRADYQQNISERMACHVVTEHRPVAGELVAFLSKTAHAVQQVNSGMRIALNGWLDCHFAGSEPSVCERSVNLDTCHASKVRKCRVSQAQVLRGDATTML